MAGMAARGSRLSSSVGVLVGFVVLASALGGCAGQSLTSGEAGVDGGDHVDGGDANDAEEAADAGTPCVAAAGDPWTFRTAFDVTDCASRAPTECSSTLADDVKVQDAFSRATGPRCQSPDYLVVRVELVGGCPTSLEARSLARPSLSLVETQYLDCLAPVLASLRVSCAVADDCIMAEHDTLN